MTGVRGDARVHRSRPWRVHALVPDFEILDVWRILIEADPSRGETFARFFDLAWANGTETDSRIVRALTRIRWMLGDAFGWDRYSGTIPGSHERSIAERLTAEDRAADRGAADRDLMTDAGERARLVYRFADEALVEVSNATAFALWHFGWVDLPNGKKTVEMAVYLRSRGIRTRSYMALIQPFRHLFVYPAYAARMVRLWEAQRATS